MNVKILPKNLLAFFIYFIKLYKYSFLFILIAGIGLVLDGVAWPYLLKVFIDKLNTYTGDKAEVWHYLMPTLLLWFGLWIFIEIAFRTQGVLFSKILPKFVASIRLKMFRYVEDHSYEFFSNNLSGTIANKIMDMAQSAHRIVVYILTLFVPVTLTFIVAIVIFFSIHPLFAGILFVWIVIHLSICLFGCKKLMVYSHDYADSKSFLLGKIVDNFTNIINVKLFSKQDFEFERFKVYQHDTKRKSYKCLIYMENIKIKLAISSMLFPGVLITWFVIYCWQHNIVTIGELVLIFNTNWNVIMLAWWFGLELPNLFKEIGVCEQALSVIKAKHDIEDVENALDLKVQKGKIVFEDVVFNYTQENKLFENKNVVIEAGSKVGLVGFSGSGKSTFVNLIIRFYDLNKGRILIDGQDISKVKRNSIRENVAMIPQNPSLFHRSLMENIRYGKVGASDSQVIQASKKAHCHEFIMQLEKGYDTLVGERGIKLSGGQRQRVAIARAMLKDSPILILDEATSALDSVTEKYINDAVHAIIEGRTTLVIAHRLSTLSEMDRILVFDKGHIIEDGTHQELINKRGNYYKMWNMQSGGFLPESLEQ